MIDRYVFYFGFFGIGGIDLGGEGEVLVWKEKEKREKDSDEDNSPNLLFVRDQDWCSYSVR